MVTLRSRPVQSKTLFFPTSPRTPFKIIPEIALLNDELAGEEWNPDTQIKFYNLLRDRDFFEGAEAKDKAFAARDRVNRVPKGLGFVTMPIIGLSDVGKEFLEFDNKEEILLRQLLKFQIPSPYHPLGKKAVDYSVKPYLELFRLIRDLKELRFDELQIFAMQLVNYSLYDTIVSKILRFRADKEVYTGRYKEFKDKIFYQEVYNIYQEDIIANNLHTRESKTETVEAFIAKKISNLKDYADACVRNLRSTGLIKVTSIGRTLSIIPERIKDVDYFLSKVNREPIFIKELNQYQAYLWNPSLPVLLTDDRASILDKLFSDFGITAPSSLSLNKLKDLLNKQIKQRQQVKIGEQIAKLKDYELYKDIEATFDTLNSTYEPSLFFEWNTWRAMTMLDGGDIKANLKFNDEGNPMNTALGNMADIICDYGDFNVTVEVTMATGALQWKMEGEPVPRHIGQNIERTNKPTYCLFIASKINPATIAHFYTLYLTNVAMYGGKCRIIPLELSTFRNMLKAAFYADNKPSPTDIRKLFDNAAVMAKECVTNDATEKEWYDRVTNYANNWLSGA